MMNGDTHKDNFYGYYQSTAWVIIRGAWLFDYLHKVYWYVVTHREMSLVKCAQNAYDEALIMHHPWILKRTVKIGMLATCSRDTFMRNLRTE